MAAVLFKIATAKRSVYYLTKIKTSAVIASAKNTAAAIILPVLLFRMFSPPISDYLRLVLNALATKPNATPAKDIDSMNIVRLFPVKKSNPDLEMLNTPPTPVPTSVIIPPKSFPPGEGASAVFGAGTGDVLPAIRVLVLPEYISQVKVPSSSYQN